MDLARKTAVRFWRRPPAGLGPGDFTSLGGRPSPSTPHAALLLLDNVRLPRAGRPPPAKPPYINYSMPQVLAHPHLTKSQARYPQEHAINSGRGGYDHRGGASFVYPTFHVQPDALGSKLSLTVTFAPELVYFRR